jgi:hypothetical protein
MSKFTTCKYCHASVPFLELREQDFDVVTRAISAGSKTSAISEVEHFMRCSESEAKAWVGHLLNCIYAFPTSEADKKILDIVDRSFSHFTKPEHFTNYTHCDECQEHDNTFLKRTRETVRREDLGNVGWDPVTFTNAEGIAYLFPTLARYALIPGLWSTHDWYASQLLTHLSGGDHNNRFFAWCGSQQREAVFSLLNHLAATRMTEIENYLDGQELADALSTWKS